MAQHTRTGWATGTSPGRRAENHLLDRLALCDACGGRMFAETMSYVRKDGTRQRVYTCQHKRRADGICDVRVPAEPVDVSGGVGPPCAD